jgi:hypothetical protein
LAAKDYPRNRCKLKRIIETPLATINKLTREACKDDGETKDERKKFRLISCFRLPKFLLSR